MFSSPDESIKLFDISLLLVLNYDLLLVVAVAEESLLEIKFVSFLQLWIQHIQMKKVNTVNDLRIWFMFNTLNVL